MVGKHSTRPENKFLFSFFLIINYQENLRRCYHGWGGGGEVKLPYTNISFRWGKAIPLDSSLIVGKLRHI